MPYVNVCVCMCVLFVICVQRPEEGFKFSFRAVAIGGCKLPVVNARNQIQVLLKGSKCS